MVMETPTAQCVGREFVRQYYTLLNQAPMHLHRFYSLNSSFVHGGVERPGEEQPPIVGQVNIHKKILSLNFRDCHAKIRQVDSQATIHDGVVVQVSGELSNNGQQMRRFMQTFILAPQSHKKYYVHNDIFRYQDEVYPDSDSEVENQDVTDMNSDSEVDSIEQTTSPDTVHEQTSIIYDTPTTISNGSVHTSEIQEVPVSHPEPVVVSESDDLSENESRKIELLPDDAGDVATDIQESKPPTWAALAGKTTPGTLSKAPNQQPVASVVKSSPVQQDSTPPAATQQNTSLRQNRDRKDRTSVGRNEGDSDNQNTRRLPQRPPDSHQVFVGSLPQKCTNIDLKHGFEQFGNVIDVRINSKGVPAFGFITFDNPDSVREVLEYSLTKAIVVNGTKLNIEEKKPRDGTVRVPGRGVTRMSTGMGSGPRGSSNMANRGGGSNRGGGMRGSIRGGSYGGGPPQRR